MALSYKIFRILTECHFRSASSRQIGFPLFFVIHILLEFISNGNRTEWSPIWSVIIRVITKWDDRATRVRFVYHEYDRIEQHEVLLHIHHKSYNLREKKNTKHLKFLHCFYGD